MHAAMKWQKQCLKWSKVTSVNMMAVPKRSSQSRTCAGTKCHVRGWMKKRLCGSQRRSWTKTPVINSQKASHGRSGWRLVWVAKGRPSTRVRTQYLHTKCITNRSQSGSRMHRNCSRTLKITTKICKGLQGSWRLSTWRITYCSRICLNSI